MKKKIVVTGGRGRFARYLRKIKTNYTMLFPKKNILDVTNYKKVKRYFDLHKPRIVIHLAALSRPMNLHKKDVKKSIDVNIIGTSNVTKACVKNNTKLIYFSTNYVYPGTKGNYKETDALLPVNNYAWSKLGGESAVQMYKNSLILRVCMTEKPFVHKSAFKNVKTSFIYHEDVAKLLFKLLNKKGIINIGGKARSAYDFAKRDNPNIKKTYLKKRNILPKNSSVNISKMVKVLKIY